MTIYRNDGTGETEITAIETPAGNVAEVYANHGDGAGERLVWQSDTPDPTTDIDHQYDAQQLRLDAGDSVTEWPDAIGGANATQSDPLFQPEFTPNGIGGQASVSFIPDDHLGAGYFDTALEQPYTFALVAQYDPSNVTQNNSYAFYGADGSQRSFLDMEFRDSGETMWWAGTTGGIRAPLSTDPHVYICVADGTDSVLRIDGHEVTGDAGTLSHPGLTIGARSDDTRGYSGLLGELRAYNYRLSETARGTLTSALADKWSLPLDYTA